MEIEKKQNGTDDDNLKKKKQKRSDPTRLFKVKVNDIKHFV